MTTAPRPGEVYLWGASTEGQPTAVPSSREQVVAGISAGSSGCALASSGAKATWLLVDDAAPAASADERAAGGLEAASAAAAVGAAAFGGGVGAGHALLLSSTGAIFTWGLGDQGQLGLGAKAAGGGASGALRLVQGNLASKRAVAVAAGTAHSVALTEAGDVYAFGRGFEGQLGIDPKSAPQMPLVSCDPAGPFPPPPMGALALVPRLCPAFIKAPVAAVACGARFSVCVTRAGAVFSWGEGQCGQLGVGRVTQARAPTLVLKASASGSPIAAVACGWAHCLAASQAGELYSWGLDHNGQLGLGDGAKARATPTLVTAADDGSLLPAVSSVAACGHHSALVAGDAGSVYTFGCGADGRLGHGAGEAPTKPRAVASLRGLIVQDVACTPKHTLAFVPTRVVALEPPLVPTKGAKQLTLRGCGFWHSDEIVVRFVPKGGPTPERPTRAAIGIYRSPSTIVCKPPAWPDVGEATVELAMNGTDFTTNVVEFGFYESPVPGPCSPRFASAGAASGAEAGTDAGTVADESVVAGSTIATGEDLAAADAAAAADGTVVITVECASIQDTGMVCVQLAEVDRNGNVIPKPPIVIPAEVHTALVGTRVNPETEEEEEVYRRYLTAKVSPELVKDRAINAKVSVSCNNGFDFVACSGPRSIVTVYDVALSGSAPRATPLRGLCSLSLLGSGLFETSKLRVRFVLADADAGPIASAAASTVAAPPPQSSSSAAASASASAAASDAGDDADAETAGGTAEGSAAAAAAAAATPTVVASLASAGVTADVLATAVVARGTYANGAVSVVVPEGLQDALAKAAKSKLSVATVFAELCLLDDVTPPPQPEQIGSVAPPPAVMPTVLVEPGAAGQSAVAERGVLVPVGAVALVVFDDDASAFSVAPAVVPVSADAAEARQLTVAPGKPLSVPLSAMGGAAPLVRFTDRPARQAAASAPASAAASTAGDDDAAAAADDGSAGGDDAAAAAADDAADDGSAGGEGAAPPSAPASVAGTAEAADRVFDGLVVEAAFAETAAGGVELRCPAPTVPTDGGAAIPQSWTVDVAVALNGIDFAPRESGLVCYAVPPNATACEPPAVAPGVSFVLKGQGLAVAAAPGAAVSVRLSKPAAAAAAAADDADGEGSAEPPAPVVFATLPGRAESGGGVAAAVPDDLPALAFLSEKHAEAFDATVEMTVNGTDWYLSELVLSVGPPQK